MSYRIELKHEPDAWDRQVIFDLLEEFNASQAGDEPERPLAVVISDSDSGRIIGGLWALTYYRWMFVELMFVPQALRGRGMGTQIMREAEEEASRRGCHGVWLETFSFQAQPFYEKLGYAPFGVVPEYPPGHRRLFMLKRIGSAESRVKSRS
jgi:GNAT superfamily N-acetyltransferase